MSENIPSWLKLKKFIRNPMINSSIICCAMTKHLIVYGKFGLYRIESLTHRQEN